MLREHDAAAAAAAAAEAAAAAAAAASCSRLIWHRVFDANVQLSQSRSTSLHLSPAHASQKAETHAHQSRHHLPALHSSRILPSQRSKRTPKPNKSVFSDSVCFPWICCRVRAIPPPSLKITKVSHFVWPQARTRQRGGKPLFAEQFTRCCSMLACRRCSKTKL